MSDSSTVDVAVIGAGPAGLAAAGAAARAGARVLLIDAAAQFGGQYWRHADEATATTDPARWHHQWRRYTSLAAQVQQGIAGGQVRYLAGTQVWSIQAPGSPAGGSRGADAPGPERSDYLIHTAPVPELHHRGASAPAGQHRARTLVLCPGAYDRQVPVPGWTLPGVMAAGGVQAFIKTQGSAPGRRVVLGGTGPFLLSAAASVLQAGGQVRTIAESAGLRGWIPRGASVLAVPSKVVEGLQYTTLLARHRVPYRTRTAITAIHGTERVEAVTTHALDARGAIRPGTARRIEGVDVVGLGWGFTPQAELLLQLHARTRVDRDGSLVGVVGGDQQASIEGLFLAGEITGVAGAAAAVAEGRIAGTAAAAKARGTARRAIGARWVRGAHRTFAAAMHHAHPLPAHWQQALTDDTVICRCEEVTWARVRAAGADLNASEPRGLKGTTRLAMGWCQGRICGLAAVCSGSGAEARDAAEQEPGRRGVAPDRATAQTGSGAPAHLDLLAAARRPVAMPVTFATMADPGAGAGAGYQVGPDHEHDPDGMKPT